MLREVRQLEVEAEAPTREKGKRRKFEATLKLSIKKTTAEQSQYLRSFFQSVSTFISL